MRVSKWGNSLAIRLPAAVVDALDLKEGDDIEIHAAGKRVFEIGKTPSTRDLLARLRRFRGRLPKDFKFNRLEASERRGSNG
jgi:antitoxin MazE